jgi:signal transduction histidine kinase
VNEPLSRLRWRLTAWYAVTLGTIVVLLGAGLFVAIRQQIAAQLDDSLRGATGAVERATAIREAEHVEARGVVMDAVAELRIPGRTLFLFDSLAHPVVPHEAPSSIVEVASLARKDSAVFSTLRGPRDQSLRAYAVRFRSPGGHRYIAAAMADKIELEDEYAALILSFGIAAFGALFLFAAGGSFLTGKSIEPVERTMNYMRRFMADAAHELRTPLTVLRSRAEVALARDAAPSPSRDALLAIEREAARLGRIVEDLLLLARSDAGATAPPLQAVFLDDVVSDAVSAASPLAERGGVSLRLDQFEEARVMGDSALLHQLVMILVDNAIKFTPEGGSVDVSVTRGADGALLSVCDTGAGIPAEQLPHVFERFFRGDASRARGEGAGLGLSIAQWIADVHGAKIGMQSEPGRGTTVEVRFPVVA